MEKEEFLRKTLESEKTLFHMAFSILHNEQDCADAVQEAITKAYAQRDKLQNNAYFKTWLTRIVINECYNLLRRRKHYVQLAERILEEGDCLGKYIKEEYLDLYRAISRLEEKEKMCILLFYMEDYSVSQIAEVLKIPQGTVKSRLNRARRQLKGLLQE